MDSLKIRIKDAEFDNEFSHKLIKSEEYFKDLYKSCSYSFELGCGSYLFDGYSYKYQIETYQKQKLLYDKSKNKKNILEIGTYMGHSILIMLMANPNAKITCIDISDKYSLPAIKYLKKIFPKSQIKFIKGNSLDVLNTLDEKYDLFHIDGAHKNQVVIKEFCFCIDLIRNSQVEFIFDDKDNILTLLKNITSTYLISDNFVPTCIYNNIYLKINFPKNKISFYFKKLNLNIKNLYYNFLKKIWKLVRLKKI